MAENENKTTQEQVTPEKIKEAIENFFSMCGECMKSDVCKIKGTPESRCCKSFYNKMNWKKYGNIYDMFKPIFEWMKFHYPSGDVYFLVDDSKAMMLQEHGVNAYHDSITKRINPLVDSGCKSVNIVKHGNMQKLFKCNNCDCEFYTTEYSDDELNFGTMFDVKMKKAWITKCPECGCFCKIERE